MELFEAIRREYQFGVGTIKGVARKLGIHRRTEAISLLYAHTQHSLAEPATNDSTPARAKAMDPKIQASMNPTVLDLTDYSVARAP